MKLECKKCENKFLASRGGCDICGTRGGYTQSPSSVVINDKTISLNDKLLHNASGNKYQIKEIQKNGFMAKMLFCSVYPSLVGKAFYISKSEIEGYTK